MCVALAGVTASCITAPSRGPVVSLLEARQQNVVIQQWDLSCGAAALATLLAYQHADPIPEKTVAETMLRRVDPLKFRIRGGFSLLDLKRFADLQGYEGSGYGELTLETLTDLAPAIVPLQAKGYKHFVVFRGLQDGRVLLADPAFGNRSMSVDQFTALWSDGIGFTVERRDGSPPPNQLTPKNQDLLLPPPDMLRTVWRP